MPDKKLPNAVAPNNAETAVLNPVVEHLTAFSVTQVFGIFNVALILGLGGVLYATRAGTSQYVAVTPNFVNVPALSLLWIVALLAYAAIIICAKARTGLRDTAAVIAAAGFFEMIGFVFLTYKTYTYIPGNPMDQQREELQSIVDEENKKLPEPINDSVSLTKISFAMRQFVFHYELKEKPGTALNMETMQTEMVKSMCSIFLEYFQSQALSSATYEFFSGETQKFSFFITAASCIPAPKNQ